MLKKTLLSVGAVASTIVPTLVNAQIVNFEDDTKYASEEIAIQTGEDKKLVLETDGYTDVKVDVTEATEKIKTGTEDVIVNTITIEDSIEGLSLTEANSKKAELEKDTKEETVVVTISAARQVSDGSLDASVTNKVFASRTDLDEEVSSLRGEGYTVTITDVTIITEDNTYTLTGTYNTASEAEAAVNAFNSAHNTTVGTYNAVRNEGKDTVTTINETRTSLTEANAYKNSLSADSVDVTVNPVTTNTASETKTGVYTDKRTAETKKAEFEGMFEVVESSTLTTQDKGTTYETIVINPYKEKYEITESDYIVFTHGEDRIIWTKVKLDKKAQDKFVETYNSFAPSAVSIKGKTEFKDGFGDLKPGYSVTKDASGKLIIKFPPSGLSHIVYGDYQQNTEHTVTVVGHNTNTTYSITGTTTDYGYDYAVSGSLTIAEPTGEVKATYTATKELFKDVYDLSIVTTTREYETRDVYEDNVYYILNISADDEAIMGQGGDEIPEEEVEVVQTGSEFDYSIMSSAAITLTLAGLVAYTKKKRD